MSEAPRDAIEQIDAEADVAAFEKALGPFVVAAEATRMPMVFTNAKVPGHPIIFANRAFLALTGYSRSEIMGKSFYFLMEQVSDSEGMAKIKAAFEHSPDTDPEIRFCRKDGTKCWATLLVCPVRDEDGNVVQHFASLFDTTKLKTQLAVSKRLIDELNHRVKNILSTVQTLVSKTLRNPTDPNKAQLAIIARLAGLARSHDLLTREEWESVGLLDLINASMKPFIPEAQEDRVVVAGENIRIQSSGVLPLSMALHELATNALKFGALANEAGRVTIDSRTVLRAGREHLHLHWIETGGPKVIPPSRKGFGSNFITKGIPYELGGDVKMDFATEGLVCTIDIPLP